MKTIKWKIEEREVPALRRIMKAGDITEDVPDNVAQSLCDQGAAELVKPATKSKHSDE